MIGQNVICNDCDENNAVKNDVKTSAVDCITAKMIVITDWKKCFAELMITQSLWFFIETNQWWKCE